VPVVTGPAPAAPPAIADAVRVAIEAFLHEQAGVLAEVAPDAPGLAEELRVLSSGGKHLRPAFCHQGWLGAGGDPELLGSDGSPTPIVRAAAALDLLHASALVHDDLMDDSATRRGRPSAHVAYADRHRELGFSGDGTRFGAGAAILLGDLAQAWADEMLRRCGLPDRRVLAGLRCFDLMRTEVMSGQYLDLLAQADPATTLEQAMVVLRFKSGRYSVMRPLELGGVLAGAEPALLAAYREIGELVGEAFQLRDDLLGVFGDPAATGKPAGDDLREGKRTVLLARTYAGADDADRAVLDVWLGNPALSDEGAAAVRGVMSRTGAVADVEQMIAVRLDRARALVADAPLADETVRDSLTELAVAAADRAA